MEILYEDQHLMVICKPSGLLSQSDSTKDVSLVDLARKHVGRNYIGLIHRLDRMTSGLMVLGKRTKSSSRLSEFLQKGKLTRKYQTLVHGSLESSQGTLTHYLWKDEKLNQTKVYEESQEGRKKAILHYHSLEKIQFKNQEFSLLEVELETGRGHQIRAQLSHIGHPLAGDHKYGKTDGFRELCLHSSFLSFPHPMELEKILTFENKKNFISQ